MLREQYMREQYSPFPSKASLSILSPIFKGFDLIPWGAAAWAKGAGRLAHVGQRATPLVQVDPFGISGPHHGTLRNLPETPIRCRKIPELFRNPKNTFPYMNLYLRTIPELLVISWIPSETPNKISVSPN